MRGRNGGEGLGRYHYPIGGGRPMWVRQGRENGVLDILMVIQQYYEGKRFSETSEG